MFTDLQSLAHDDSRFRHPARWVCGSAIITMLNYFPILASPLYSARLYILQQAMAAVESEKQVAEVRRVSLDTSAVQSLNCGSRFSKKFLFQRFTVAICTDLDRADNCRIACESQLCLFTLVNRNMFVYTSNSVTFSHLFG